MTKFTAAWKYGCAVVAVAALGACSSDPGVTRGQEVFCTGVHSSSWVWFKLASVVEAAEGPGEHWTVRGCIGAHCRKLTKPRRIFGDGLGGFTVNDFPRTGDVAPVTLTVRDENKRLLFDGSTRVKPQKYQPNGPPPCEPTLWRAGVKTQGLGGLVQFRVDRGDYGYDLD